MSFRGQIYSGKDLTEAMAKIQAVLSDDKNDWEDRVAAVSCNTPRVRNGRESGGRPTTTRRVSLLTEADDLFVA